MRVLVCGGRDFYDYKLLDRTLEDLMVDEKESINAIIHGDASGADRLAGQFANYISTECLAFPADWKKYGVAAGPIRNKEMLEKGKPDLVVAFLAKNSKGTKNMVEQAQKAGVRVKIVEV